MVDLCQYVIASLLSLHILFSCDQLPNVHKSQQITSKVDLQNFLKSLHLPLEQFPLLGCDNHVAAGCPN